MNIFSSSKVRKANKQEQIKSWYSSVLTYVASILPQQRNTTSKIFTDFDIVSRETYHLDKIYNHGIVHPQVSFVKIIFSRPL